jgi:ribosome biogenesis GTPase / thiamine phosphate phosphatase
MEETIDRSGALLGTVVAVQANFYQVRLTGEDGEEILLLCTRRARLKKIGQKVMVGDRVVVVEADFQDKQGAIAKRGAGAIAKVLERQSELERPPIANVEQILLVFSIAEPILDPWQLSRFLVKAESTGLEICLCLNKVDLVGAEIEREWRDRLHEWGYKPLFVSIMADKGLEALNELLKDKITVLAGASGVGKSSLVDRLIPNLNLRIGRVSGKLQKGRHTTRHVELFSILDGGFLADSPGFNQPDLICDPANVALYFPEAKTRLEQNNCQFANCLHREEPNCAVRGDWERYEHYLCFLEEIIKKQEILQQRADVESNLKLKSKGAGKEEYEPKLASKKYRRPSRRGDKQILQDKLRMQSWEELVED